MAGSLRLHDAEAEMRAETGLRYGRFVTRAGAALLVALAMAGAGTPVQAGTHAPLGFQLMCLQHPEECKGGGARSVKATNETMSVLKRVNAMVNRSITPRNDRGADVWNANATAGDCEDYVLAKRKALIRAGLPASALRIGYVKTRAGEGHAILIVRTSQGEFVLDNLTQAIKPLSQTGYRILSISGADPKHWT
jgi:predicted transglutaminase-like cysteine proteinase